MRYLNWDILLFPDESRVPVQEFDVKCHVLAASKDILQTNKLLGIVGPQHVAAATQIPTMTCFIPSLEHGQDFRISIHSWEKPKPSDLFLSFRPPAERIAFEGKLYVDRHLKAQRILGANNSWPEVISGTNAEFRKQLLFPPFHKEILQQSHWDASDGLGRVRVVIAEGVQRYDGQGFDKLRDIVAFSFQHAPRNVLEYSGIAWPNARMFQKSSASAKGDFDAHAHSPTRTCGSTILQNGEQYGMKDIPMAIHSAGTWAEKRSQLDDDPFVGPARSFVVQPRRKTNTDVSMPDYPPSKKPVEMSGVELHGSDFQQQLNRATVDDLVRALTPTKRYALLNALSPLEQNDAAPIASRSSTMKQVAPTRAPSTRLFEQMLRTHTSSGSRHVSAESRRSTSGKSTVMSWDETPTLGDLWPTNSNDFPGLLQSIHSPARSIGAGSMGAKRKRGTSPHNLLPLADDALTCFQGMSTSPCKPTPTPTEKGNSAFDSGPASLEKHRKSANPVVS